MPRKAHTFTGPLIAAGHAGAVLLTKMLRNMGLPQPLTDTATEPLLKVVGKRKLMLDVPCPLTLLAPLGMVQL